MARETGDRGLHRSEWTKGPDGAQGGRGDRRELPVQSVQPEVPDGAQDGEGDRRPRSPSERVAGGPERRPGRPGRPATEVSIGASGRRGWTVPGWRGSPATEVSIGAAGRRSWTVPREDVGDYDRGPHRGGCGLMAREIIDLLTYLLTRLTGATEARSGREVALEMGTNGRIRAHFSPSSRRT